MRWILPGTLAAAVSEWFGGFPSAEESREDFYLLKPRLPGLSVKLRAGAALELKVYDGSRGNFEVADRARGRMESWRKWSFPYSPPSPGGDLVSWEPVRKRRCLSRFSRECARATVPRLRLGRQPQCEVDLAEIHTSGRSGGLWASRRPAITICSAASFRPPPSSCSPMRRPASSRASRKPGRMRSGCLSFQAPESYQHVEDVHRPTGPCLDVAPTAHPPGVMPRTWRAATVAI